LGTPRGGDSGKTRKEGKVKANGWEIGNEKDKKYGWIGKGLNR